MGGTRLAAANRVDARGGAWRRRCLRHRRGWLSRGEAVQIRWFPDGTASVDGGGRRWTVADGGGQWRTAAEDCRQWRTVLKCCLTVLGSSKTRLNELGQPRTAAVTNVDRPRTAVTETLKYMSSGQLYQLSSSIYNEASTYEKTTLRY